MGYAFMLGKRRAASRRHEERAYVNPVWHVIFPDTPANESREPVGEDAEFRQALRLAGQEHPAPWSVGGDD
jgi:hypothetical protein